MKDKKATRRAFIRRSIELTAVFTGGEMLLSNCSSGSKETNEQAVATPTDPCQDLSGVNTEEIQKRENLGYVKESPIADNQCNNCNLYLPPGDKDCGACILFKGPVEAEGYCTYWAPKV